jgi:hypothetical protein
MSLLKKAQKSLVEWGKQKWGTKSGQPSSKTGERYLPEKAREALSDSEYAATSAKKRKDKAAGKQHSPQPKKIAEKTARYRSNKGGLTDAEIINMVEDKSWFKRATQPGGDKYKGKHTLLTASSGDGTKEYLYPTIREVDGKLVDLGDKAFDVAMQKKDYIIFEGKDKEKRATEVSKKISDLIIPMRQMNKQMTEGRLPFKKGGKADSRLKRAGVSGYNQPKRTPNHPTKSHIVVAKVGDKIKTIRFGEQGAKTAGKPKAGESARMKAKRKSFKARHAKNIAKGKLSAAYWADKVKW